VSGGSLEDGVSRMERADEADQACEHHGKHEDCRMHLILPMLDRVEAREALVFLLGCIQPPPSIRVNSR
jgi:hypothetical protein